MKSSASPLVGAWGLWGNRGLQRAPKQCWAGGVPGGEPGSRMGPIRDPLTVAGGGRGTYLQGGGH